MAESSEDIRKNFERLQKLADQLKKDFSKLNLKPVAEDAATVREILSSWQKEAYETEDRNFRQCRDCKIWINTTERTFHCDYCGICIENYDHHCIWLSNCIGKNNIFTFRVFLICILIKILINEFISFKSKIIF